MHDLTGNLGTKISAICILLALLSVMFAYPENPEVAEPFETEIVSITVEDETPACELIPASGYASIEAMQADGVAIEDDIPPEAKVVGNCTVTYYDICEKCCGKTDGITYSGALTVPYETCAVDPDVIPLGSTVLIDFGNGLMESYRAEDTGGGVDGNHIDICVASHEEAVNLGVREAAVYWLPTE